MARLFEWPAEHRPSGRGWTEGLGLLLGGREQLAMSCTTPEVLGKTLSVYHIVCMDIFVNRGADPCSGICCPFVFFFPCSVLGIGHCFHVSEADACKFLCQVLAKRAKTNLRFNHG